VLINNRHTLYIEAYLSYFKGPPGLSPTDGKRELIDEYGWRALTSQHSVVRECFHVFRVAGTKFPIKWTAPEAVKSAQFSTKSDSVFTCFLLQVQSFPSNGRHLKPSSQLSSAQWWDSVFTCFLL